MLNDLGSQMKTVCLYMRGSRKFCGGGGGPGLFAVL